MKFVIVTERDCTERQAARSKVEPRGPLVHETYFESAGWRATNDRIEDVFADSMGWARPYLLLSVPQALGIAALLIFITGGIAWLVA